MKEKVIIIMGSRADLEWAEKMVTVLNSLEIGSVVRIASAH